jgi:hypothetical protein
VKLRVTAALALLLNATVNPVRVTEVSAKKSPVAMFDGLMVTSGGRVEGIGIGHSISAAAAAASCLGALL